MIDDCRLMIAFEFDALLLVQPSTKKQRTKYTKYHHNLTKAIKMISHLLQKVVLLLSFFVTSNVHAFAPTVSRCIGLNSLRVDTTILATSDASNDPKEIIGKTIKVKGDVNGGYVRTCIKNEASQFRKLIGTMSPPGDSEEATIYVEGKRRMVDGFVRWCKKGTDKIGLSQKLTVVEVAEEVPTGLYDGFYIKMKEE